MKITNEILQDAIHCSYKVFKKINNHSVESQAEISLLYKKLKEEHSHRLQRNFIDSDPSNKINRQGIKKDLIFSSRVQNERVDLIFDAIETTSKKRAIVILTVPFERITKADKLLLALQAYLAAREFSMTIEYCKVIYGEEFKTLKFKSSTFKREVHKIIANLTKLVTNSTPPVFYKNNHCQFCEFHSECITALRQRDDLSLLSGLKPHEIVQKNSRGIFTVKQLSYIFRARRNLHGLRKFSPELKALAIRDNKTYIKENWVLPTSDVEVFLDIEGIPERNLNYLIGLVIRTKESEETFSFWADNEREEREIFDHLINILSRHPAFLIYHYGAYEQRVLRNISKLFPSHLPFITKMLENSVNVLSLLTENIYPPTYSNGLKEVAGFLGFKWTDANASGLQSIVWRYDWESSRNVDVKQKLLRYNIEDCRALMKVFDWICAINEPTRRKEYLPETKQVNLYKWGITEYAINDFEDINSKAYFNYQRHHITLRKSLGQIAHRRRDNRLKLLNKPQRKISQFPTKCPRCRSSDLVVHSAEKVQVDLIFMKNGFKSSITEYSGGPFLCKKCKGKFKGVNMRALPKYGRNLMIWSVSQKVQYNLSSESVINFLRDTAKIDVSPTQMTRFKEVVAQLYRNTYEEIIERLVRSELIHVDETIARIKGIDGYVWVFANHECVYYEFRKTREADFLKARLTSFKGTLVSDFYTGYDSIECNQQKCLVHLIRDMNEDYLKNQFDQEFKLLVVEFGKMLGKIVSTIDQYGLKKLHLNKHRNDVKRFYTKFVNVVYGSEAAQNYRRRLTKYRDRLFRFLEEDNIPWNNNNAEHSIKPFAKWRKRKTFNLTVENIDNHLILLSILQTCKYRGVSFFEFMKSGELSVFKFSETNL